MQIVGDVLVLVANEEVDVATIRELADPFRILLEPSAGKRG